jgi:putative phage-type endonuclease
MATPLDTRLSILATLLPFQLGEIPTLTPLNIDTFVDDLEWCANEDASTETDHSITDTELYELVEGGLHFIEGELINNQLMMSDESADMITYSALYAYFADLLKQHLTATNSDNDSDSEEADTLSHSNSHARVLTDMTLDTFYRIHPRRSHPQRWGNRVQERITPSLSPSAKSISNQFKDRITAALELVREKNASQPAQRTPDWYIVRYNLISASSAWMALGSEANRNQLIRQKTGGVGMESGGRRYADPNSPLQWGQRYEPISIQIYEEMFDAQIEQFGCIPHSIYEFIGASPDGINVKASSPTYGRMLEIKNVVSRELSGIPKKEYWIQTQLQLEVCDLEECDLFECKFVEYASSREFWAGGKGGGEDAGAVDDRILTEVADGAGALSSTVITPTPPTPKYRGIIMEFSNEGEPLYEYPPLSICDNEDEFDVWADKKQAEHEARGNHWIRNHYWRLETYSCVLIERNRAWFQSAVPIFERVWTEILNQRKPLAVNSVVDSSGDRTSPAPQELVKTISKVRVSSPIASLKMSPYLTSVLATNPTMEISGLPPLTPTSTAPAVVTPKTPLIIFKIDTD